MDEQTIDTKHRRKPSIALVLSLLRPGLGHVYCGKFVKGLFLAFIFTLLPIFVCLSVIRTEINFEIIILDIITSIVIWVIIAVDSYRTARRTSPDYQLKDYNRWYVYLLLGFFIADSSLFTITRIKTNLIEAFKIPKISYSMFPTILGGDLVLANKLAYKSEEPKRGDVVVFTSPEDRKQLLNRRVIAIAGDTVEMRNNLVYVNGEQLERKSEEQTSYIDSNQTITGKWIMEKTGGAYYKIFMTERLSKSTKTEFAPIKIGAQQCFVLGDNRNLSIDSRYFGPVPLATIKGKIDYLYWPASDWSRFGKIE